MKPKKWMPWLLAAALCCSGCLVHSVNPWIAKEATVADTDLAGTWHDAGQQQTAFFTADGEEYKVVLVDGGERIHHFRAAVYRVEGVPLLVAGPNEDALSPSPALMPVYLLLKMEQKADTLVLYPIDTDGFAERLEKAAIPVSGSEVDGFVLLAKTEKLTAFVRSQLDDPTFFNEEPAYTFSRLPGK